MCPCSLSLLTGYLNSVVKRNAKGPLAKPLKRTDASSVYRIMAAFFYPIEQSVRRRRRRAAALVIKRLARVVLSK